MSGDELMDVVGRFRTNAGPSGYSAAFVWLNPTQDPGVTPLLLDEQP